MRGQYFSFDAIVASVIFILALIALLSYWHSVKNYLDYQGGALSQDAIRISNQVLTTSGSSADCDNLETLGFALSESDPRLNSTTLTCATSKDQAWLKKKLGTPYNVSINVTQLSDEQHPVSLYVGGPLPPAQNEVVKIRRLVSIYDDSHVQHETYLGWMEIVVYR